MPYQSETGAVAPIDAAEKRIQDIFSDDYAFEVPYYQRPYAWEIEQTDQLLDDLTEAMQNPTEVYFLGSIVLIKVRSKPEARIVDGQQRITTLTILLAVLRDLTADTEVSIERDSYVKQKGSRDRGTQDRVRLKLRNADQRFFLQNIQDRGATARLNEHGNEEGAQLRILQNALHLREKLSKEFDEDRRSELMNFLLTRCYLVVVSVPTQETARRIFTVLNARGLDLTATDILKAQLLERIPDAIAERDIANRWEEFESKLGRDEFVAMFAHIRMIERREKSREALETAFPKEVKSFAEEPARFVEQMLEPYTYAFDALRNGERVGERFGASAEECAVALNRLDNTDWRAPALAYLKKFAAHRDLPKQLPTFLAQLEGVAYQLFVTRANENKRIRRFADVIKEIVDESNAPGDQVPSLKISLDEGARAVEALNKPIYSESRIICKPVLLRLDELLSNRTARYTGEVSIEHVLPQAVESESTWAALFPDENDRRTWTHRLANLVLLNRRTNTAASNWDFDRKKGEYFQRKDGRNPYPLTQEVIDEQSWTPDVLRLRQRRLIEILSGHWNWTRHKSASSKDQIQLAKAI